MVDPTGLTGRRWTHTSRRLRLRPDVHPVTAPDGQVALLHAAQRGELIGRLTAGEAAVLRLLVAGAHPERTLLATLTSSNGRDGGADSTLLARLHDGGWLTVHYDHGAQPLITARPLGPHRRPRPVAPDAPRLSRFAVLRRDGDQLVMESPLATAAVTVHDPRVLTLLHQLAAGTAATGGEAADQPRTGLPAAIAAELVRELTWHGFVHRDGDETATGLAAEGWGGHELWFHSRSRIGGHDLPSGDTQWAAGRFPALPARREPFPGPVVALPRPDAATMADPPLGTVLDDRRSVRAHDDDRPLTLAQLAEFLHRSARVIRVAVDGQHEVTLRPSPSGGAIHSLEIYPVVSTVAGLAAGMYHYDPFGHVLEPVPASGATVRQLAAAAGAAAGQPTVPQVLLVISARFGRVMWKYQNMAYALALKDLGALMQSMYLVATAMGLAPCALGAGDTTLFATATGADPLAESSVGEFILGSRPISVRDHGGNNR